MAKFVFAWTIVLLVGAVYGQADPCAVRCNTKAVVPVCAYNGLKYKVFINYCLMLTENCQAENEWEQVSLVECNKRIIQTDRCDLHCTEEHRPICGSADDHYEIFENECLLRQQKCRDRKLWIQHPISHCELMASESQRTVNCPRICPMNYSPICATNGIEEKIFGNQCAMDVENCNARTAQWVRARSTTACGGEEAMFFRLD